MSLFERLLRFYAFLTRLYPPAFRREFAVEMQAVFCEKLFSRQEGGTWELWRSLWEELRDWPAAVLAEYWFVFRKGCRRRFMSGLAEDKSWKIEEWREALLASLPPLMLGVCIALGALVVWEPWYTIPRWRLMMGFAIMMLPGAFVAVGGLVAMVKRLPAWGYTWAGAAMMGLVVFVKLLAEERADVGLPLFSPALDIALLVLLLLGILALVVAAARRGWRQAGLVSLGFASIAGMSSFSMATAAPFNRYDLALLAAPVGLWMAWLIWLYVRKGDIGRGIALLGFGAMNAAVLLVIADAWHLPAGRPSPVVPFLTALTASLLVGPLAGLIGGRLRRMMQRG